MKRLKEILGRIDRRGYRAYKELDGIFRGDFFSFELQKIQGDPFARPSIIKITLPESGYDITAESETAAEDFIYRCLAGVLGRHSARRGSGGSGGTEVDRKRGV